MRFQALWGEGRNDHLNAGAILRLDIWGKAMKKEVAGEWIERGDGARLDAATGKWHRVDGLPPLEIIRESPPCQAMKKVKISATGVDCETNLSNDPMFRAWRESQGQPLDYEILHISPPCQSWSIPARTWWQRLKARLGL